MLSVAYPALLGLDVAAIGLVQPEPKAAQRTHIVARLADHLVNLLLATSDVITWRRLLMPVFPTLPASPAHTL